ncbi:MAG: Uridylate kinase [Candidatus Heimdallarchaeota archaeon LC_2]|nr:MAG: Uridylate kinase [Candidatus Heimdallarchaeota archaeon LC_2]
MKLILKIGGSILFNDNQINVNLIKEWIDLIRKLNQEGHQIGVVVGGGKPARDFAKVAGELGANDSYQDFIGIEAARQNARLLISGLPEAYPHPPKDYQELISIVNSNPLVIVGGFQPGQSTNAVAAIFAEYIQADFLFNLSNITHVFDKDPAKFEDAIPLEKISYDDFAEIIKQNEQSPGKYALFDIVGLSIVQRSEIKLVFLDGRIPNLLLETINGNNNGTIIK